MSYSLRSMATVALALLLSTPALADPLTVTMTTPMQALKPGVAMPVTVAVTNTLTPKPPVIITCSIEWTDWLGEEHVADGPTLSIPVIQPLTLRVFAVPLPTGCEYVTGTGLVDGVLHEPALISGALTWSLQRELLEGQSIGLQYSVRAQ